MGSGASIPLGGCLPLLVQMPIFITLYYTIRQFEKLESFRTGGLLWFQDLTLPDHLYILPIVYVLTMMASQEITIRNTAPQQAQLMRFLPIVFGFFLARFPAGLLVYSITTTSVTFVQNFIIYHRASHPSGQGHRGLASTDGPKPLVSVQANNGQEKKEPASAPEARTEERPG